MEGPKRAPRGCGLWRGAIAPPQYGGLGGLCPQKNLKKINLEIAYFFSFLQAEIVSSALFSHAVLVRND